MFQRVNTVEPWRRTVDEFDGLVVRECTFTSNHGQRLAGYVYSKAGLSPKGVVIIAQGLGMGGHCYYMPTADYLTSHGYLVFAYDATGMDKSEGNSAGGMEQGVIDLDHAIDYVEHDGEMGKYPLALFGHSWGAYAVATVLNVHPEVKAVVAVSGFNRPHDLYKYISAGNTIIPAFFTILERMRFGKYAAYSSLSGFAKTKAGVMVIQSEDDKNVPVETGYDLYLARYKDDDRFRFVTYEQRGHMFIFFTDASIAYDRMFFVTVNGQPTEYGKEHAFDKKTGYVLDQQLYKEILDFYDGYCKP